MERSWRANKDACLLSFVYLLTLSFSHTATTVVELLLVRCKISSYLDLQPGVNPNCKPKLDASHFTIKEHSESSGIPLNAVIIYLNNL